ncbi:transcriptional regulator, GntR family [Tistlia consotensis]|uniref:Transcriptional regulator, GntR family n=1 Tax=Tistlia consotensis USBA 355 TaxID=560819 RepID=A0A1Y6BQK6_9PROT|nr:PLP-dependent aminotransferase family protein [Tistlia consotensis]SMF13244.1 transcriptional regulator, GntR family [Tistlia consotensis USBA 355]SNR50646.1 transcriptional regulator, GntR family [Tistlia consotensis]
MLDRYLGRPFVAGRTLQEQLHERLVEAVLDGAHPPHQPLPATRELARILGMSRNTVSLVYERLTADGYLTPVPRRGHFINEQYVRQQLNVRLGFRPDALFGGPAEADPWSARLRVRPSLQRNIAKPTNWAEYPYPFIYGQVSLDRVSIARWRDCVRLAGSSQHAAAWASDLIDADDPLLLAQIVSRILPQRGLRAEPDQLLVTVGTQNALYLLATLLSGPGTVFGVENPGYVDARNIAEATGATLRPLPVDANGLLLSQALEGCDLIYLTASHQSPTSVTLSLQRRLGLVEWLRGRDALLIEDDYEHELNFVGPQHAAVKSFDTSGRIAYLGSLSKSLFPGLRLGFVVAPPALVRELRALRRLMYRHPSALDQRAMALFLAGGHFDAHIRRLRDRLSRKWSVMLRELDRLLPDCRLAQTTGGSALWLRLPKRRDGSAPDAWDLQRAAARRGVLIEPGDIHFAEDPPPSDYVRLGFAAIAEERIAPGLALLREALDEVLG